MTKPCRRGLRGAKNPWETSLALFGMILLFAILTGCGGLDSAVTSAPPPNQQLNTSINHIIFMAQENRGFDHYFGKLPDYWKANGYPNQTFDGLPPNASNLADDGST